MRIKLISSDGSTIIEVDDSQVEYLKSKGWNEEGKKTSSSSKQKQSKKGD
jgi:hypothetical protein|tara:strand:- start:64 stop:213 length:150 start_codon:yes stop_codon:yes gene_type:complete